MPTDVLLDDDFDLLFEGGDLVLGESTSQHQKLLLLTDKGEIRNNPLRGVGVGSWLLDNSPGDLNGEVKRQFEGDGMVVGTIKSKFLAGSLTNIDLDANYK